MRVAVTGAAGFIGHYIVRHLVGAGHACRCWHRRGSDRSGLQAVSSGIEWLAGDLLDRRAAGEFARGADAVVHAALFRPGKTFRGGEGDLVEFARQNILGSLMLIEAARSAGAGRFVFISTCAVHDVICDDRPLDEVHPMWSKSHYGAHKAAIEEFVYSYGLGEGYDVCALRPTGVYGVHHDPRRSKWYDLIKAVAGGDVTGVGPGGGKEVHAADVARAVGILLQARDIAGQAYNCCDLYVAQEHVAGIAARLSGQELRIPRLNPGPQHQIDTTKLRALGMTFGGPGLLERTVGELLALS